MRKVNSWCLMVKFLNVIKSAKRVSAKVDFRYWKSTLAQTRLDSHFLESRLLIKQESTLGITVKILTVRTVSSITYKFIGLILKITNYMNCTFKAPTVIPCFGIRLSSNFREIKISKISLIVKISRRIDRRECPKILMTKKMIWYW